uniref:Succinate dehydrogenase [ubiquinone] cytochrome b small subunit n=2 Tax=Chlamydomonas reinhardtii TaxID=3055 RepID=A0A1Q2XCW7_CHLRE|nr:TPA_inf: mitochondrial succinate dehydrogenase subunit 4 [Chlamydomonas reinhardtii]
MQRVLQADTAGGHAFHKAHEFAGYGLAGATPLAIFSSKGSILQRTADFIFSVAIPVHSHITMNAVVTDYLPKAARGPARVGVLGMSVVTYLGIMKMNLAGPGLTETVKGLWRKPQPAAASK